MEEQVSVPAWVTAPLSAGEVLPVTLAIPLLALTVLTVIAIWLARAGERPAALRFVGGAALWIALTGFAAVSGRLADVEARPPLFALFMPAVIGLGLALGRSRAAGVLAQQLPLSALVGLQAFRLPLEVTMHHAAEAGLMPVELSWSGYNFDVVSGALAVVVVVAAAAGAPVRALAWLWNIVGACALVSIAAIAVTTSPLLHAFGTDPAHVNWWVTRVPYVWLPAVLVAVAVAGHVVVTRALLQPAAAPRP